MRTAPTTSASIVVELGKNEVVTLLQENAGTANGYQWSKIRRANNTEGYVATTYLTKCGT